MPARPAALWFDPSALLCGGVWRPAEGGGTLPVTDPSDGITIGEIARGTAADIDAAVSAAAAARTGDWGRLTAAERGRLLMRLSAIVRDRAEDLALIEAQDVGKPLSQARADALALSRYAEFYGGAADKLMGDTIPYLGGYTVWTLREPHGVTGHIVPWNYPMQILGRSLCGALAAGNACVVKPAEDACLTALAIGRMAEEAGFPPGAIGIVPGLGAEAGAALAAHPGVHHISFTGSVAAGAAVQAAAAANAVPVTLELGGKSPQIVFADADLDRALPFLVNAGIQNAGQTCSAASRILVERRALPEVAARMAARYRALVAAPARADRDLGPLVSARQRARVQGFLARALGAGIGAEVLAEGRIDPSAPEGGFYHPAVLVGGVSPADEIAREEVFGPVQVILPFESEDEAVAIANGTGYGLVAGVWTQDMGRALRLARRIEAGQVFLNNYGAGGGVELPFGGTGRSGHGREKGFEALLGFTRVKTVAAWHG